MKLWKSLQKHSIEQEANITDGSLMFEHVDFKYGVKPILSDVNFEIPQSKVTAFVGPSGSGKSTIFNIIERMYDIDQGILNMVISPFMTSG